MTDSLAGVVLAAGRGERLRPLTLHRPKALCPVDNVPLVDLAIERVAPVAGDVAVNVHHRREQLEAHLAGRVHLSVEEPEPLGTAGALGRLRGWLDGRAALVVNADAWCPGDLTEFVQGWDGERVRLLLSGEDALRPSSLVVASLMPWAAIARLEPVPSGLYETSWRPAASAGQLDVAAHHGPMVDCGTPERYLTANLTASGGKSVVGPGARVHGTLVDSVVWAGATVGPSESLVRAIRLDGRTTVLVR